MKTFEFKEDSRHYISLLQDVVNRMAANSASCKKWLISIVTALLALQATHEEVTRVLLMAVFPIVIFFLLDSYYLGLEKRFIKLEEKLIKSIKSCDSYDGLYNLNPRTIGSDFGFTLKGMKSYSTWPFYVTILSFVIVLSCCSH